MSRVFRLLPDSFTAAIIAVVSLAVMLPCSGDSARLVGIGSEVAIAVLFFLQGARLSRSAVLGAALHWRLHGIVASLRKRRTSRTKAVLPTTIEPIGAASPLERQNCTESA